MSRAVDYTTRRALMATAAVGFVLSVPAAALAQQVKGPAAAAASSDPGSASSVQEVVVTAQLRTENLDRVPISAIVLSGKALVEQNINNLDTLSQQTPSIHVGNYATAADIYIRGVGAGTNASFDQAVGTFVDGVYYGKSRVSSATFFDLDHIEVLKGPQSTFFGNNAIAGAFNIGTRAPSSEFGGTARVLYGTYGDRVAEVAVTGPLTDNLSARVALHYDGTNGWLQNVGTSNLGGASHLPAADNVGARLTLLYTPTDKLSVKLKAEYSSGQNNGLGLQGTNCPQGLPFTVSGFCAVDLGLGLGNAMGYDKNKVTQNPGQFFKLQTESEVLTVNYTLGEHTLTSISAHTHYNFNSALDLDGTPEFLASGISSENYDQLSQELRLASPTGQRVEYLAGVYVQGDRLLQDQQQYLPYLDPLIQSVPALAALDSQLPLGVQRDFTQTETTAAAFGSISWHATDKLTLTGGLRYEWVHKSVDSIQEFGKAIGLYDGLTLFSGTINPQNNGQVVSTGLQGLASFVGLGPAGTEAHAGNFAALLPSAKVQYQFDPHVMGYFSYAKGFLAGGFNGLEATGIQSDAPYQPETVTAYEVGVKSALFDGRVILNADAFYSQFSDFQVTQSIPQLGGVRNLITNAASVITKGVEVDGSWRLTDDFHLSGNVAYDDADYGLYTNVAQSITGQYCHSHVGNPTCITDFGGNGDPGALRNLSGQQTPFAPKWAGSVTASYAVHAGGLNITPSLTAVFSSSYFPSGGTLNDALFQQPSYVRLDSQITIAQADNSRWAVDLIGKNLTDQTILTTALQWPNTPGGVLAAKEEPISGAIQLRLNW
jgi:iron complex outermembrane receptor protein